MGPPTDQTSRCSELLLEGSGIEPERSSFIGKKHEHGSIQTSIGVVAKQMAVSEQNGERLGVPPPESMNGRNVYRTSIRTGTGIMGEPISEDGRAWKTNFLTGEGLPGQLWEIALHPN